MNKICTDINQCNKFIELGIDVNTADMYWEYDYNIHGEYKYYPKVMDERFDDVCIPAWSLSALLELIHNNSYILRNTGVETNRYNIWAIQRKSPVWCKTPLDAAFEMLVWLKENGKL